MQSQLSHIIVNTLQQGNNCQAALWSAIEMSSYDRTPEGKFTPGSQEGDGYA
jgi:hypothetical protein